MLEIRFFLGSFLGGVTLLAAYDVLRLLRRIVPHKRGWVNGEDLLFWVAASIYIFRMIYRLNDGEIRGYGILSMAIGMFLYHFILSDGILELSYRTFGTFVLKIARILKKGLKKAVKPFKIKINKLKNMQGLHRNEDKDEGGQADKKKC